MFSLSFLFSLYFYFIIYYYSLCLFIYLFFIRPKTPGGKVFVVFYAIISLGVMAAAITSIGNFTLFILVSSFSLFLLHLFFFFFFFYIISRF